MFGEALPYALFRVLRDLKGNVICSRLARRLQRKAPKILQNKHRNTSDVDLSAFLLDVAIAFIYTSSRLGLLEL